MLSLFTASALDTYFLIRIFERIVMNTRLFLFLQTIACANTARSQNRRAICVVRSFLKATVAKAQEEQERFRNGFVFVESCTWEFWSFAVLETRRRTKSVDGFQVRMRWGPYEAQGQI